MTARWTNIEQALVSLTLLAADTTTLRLLDGFVTAGQNDLENTDNP